MRIFMVGGGQRGLALAADLVAEGHAVRAATRTESRRGAIEAAGCECWIGDPDRVGTLRNGLENVTVLMWLLGTVTSADPAAVAALHGSRLRMMLERTIDTTVRGVVYENAGPVPREVLDNGLAECEHALATNEIPFGLIDADPNDIGQWRVAAHAAIETVLGATLGA